MNDLVAAYYQTYAAYYNYPSIKNFIEQQHAALSPYQYVNERREKKRIIIPELLRATVKHFEGCKLVAYRDKHTGVWTCGFGVTDSGFNIKKGTTWTQEYADRVLDILLERAYLAALVSSPGLQFESVTKQVAITDFIYNLGLGGYLQSDLKEHVDHGTWEEAQIEILKYHHAKGRDVQGLKVRRSFESQLLKN